jgi:Ser-tRNA(Ala) deacylase AlaX
MAEMQRLDCEAHVLDVREVEGKRIIVLDQTIFYPQGGGQPYDRGFIKSGENVFEVKEVRYQDGEVLHIGEFVSGVINTSDQVVCEVSRERRELHTRLHSAGHIIDFALSELGFNFAPKKGYHWPEGAYDEYFGDITQLDKEKFQRDLEAKCNEITSRDVKTEVKFMSLEEMKSVCAFPPSEIPGNKPGRVVMYGERGIPCGGTHVANLRDVGHMTIRKVKQEKEIVRVAYGL